MHFKLKYLLFYVVNFRIPAISALGSILPACIVERQTAEQGLRAALRKEHLMGKRILRETGTEFFAL
jgi:hypothetical protein